MYISRWPAFFYVQCELNFEVLNLTSPLLQQGYSTLFLVSFLLRLLLLYAFVLICIVITAVGDYYFHLIVLLLIIGIDNSESFH